MIAELKKPSREDIVFYKYTGNMQKMSRPEAQEHLESFKASDDYSVAQKARDDSL